MKKIYLILLSCFLFNVSTFDVNASTLDSNVYVELNQSSVVSLDEFVQNGNIIEDYDDLYLVVEIDYYLEDQYFVRELKSKEMDKDSYTRKLADFFHKNNQSLLSKSLKNLGIDDEQIFYSSYTPIVFVNCNDIDVTSISTELSRINIVKRVTIYQQEIYAAPQALCFLDANGNCVSPEPDYREDTYDNFQPDLLYRGNGIKIGILDTGYFDETHSNFVGIYTETVIDTYTPEAPAVDTNHPTEVASILGGKYGLASKSSIYYADVNSTDGITNIELLVSENVDVINMSIKLSHCGDENQYNSVTEKYFDYIAYSSNVILVAAAGNGLDKVNNDGSVCQPASSSNIISVGSIDVNGNPSYFSSYVTEYIPKSNPVISAVGEDRFVTGFGSLTGTSYSAPAVTGAIALLLDKFGSNLTTSGNSINTNCNF